MDITDPAIVTGGASGIGAAAARQLAAKGATVVVADLQADKGEALAEEIGGVFASVDVTEHRADRRRRRDGRRARARCGSWSTRPASAGPSAPSASDGSSTRRTTSTPSRR